MNVWLGTAPPIDLHELCAQHAALPRSAQCGKPYGVPVQGRCRCGMHFRPRFTLLPAEWSCLFYRVMSGVVGFYHPEGLAGEVRLLKLAQGSSSSHVPALSALCAGVRSMYAKVFTCLHPIAFACSHVLERALADSRSPIDALSGLPSSFSSLSTLLFPLWSGFRRTASQWGV